MNGDREGPRPEGQLEEVERGLQSVLERLDDALRLCEELQAGQRALHARLADLEHSDVEDRLAERIERITSRTEAYLDRLERRVDNHEGDHWRERR